MRRLIAVVGMSGSGKSIATEYLENQGWTKLYFGGITYKLMAEAGIERTPDGKSEKKFREKLRQDHGPECYAKFLESDIKEALKVGNVVLDGLYSWDELKILKEEFGDKMTSIAIIVDRKTRYERLENRPIRPFSKEKANERDISEIENIAKAGPIAYADYYIDNNKNVDDFKIRLEEILKEIERTNE